MRGRTPAPLWDSVDGFTKTMVEDYGVQLYDSVAEMCDHVDCVFLESVDGRPHLEQVCRCPSTARSLPFHCPSTALTPSFHRLSLPFTAVLLPTGPPGYRCR